MAYYSYEFEREDTIKRKIAYTGLAGILLTAIIALTIIFIHNHHNSQEYLRKKELEKRCIYILPAGKERNFYWIDGNRVEVYHYNHWWNKSWMKIELNDEVRFFSEDFKGISLKDNAKSLDVIVIKTEDGKWKRIPREKIQDYNSWQKIYEDLIEKIAEEESKFQKDTREKIENSLKYGNQSNRTQIDSIQSSQRHENSKLELLTFSQEEVKNTTTQDNTNQTILETMLSYRHNGKEILYEPGDGKMETLLSVKNIPTSSTIAAFQVGSLSPFESKTNKDITVYLRRDVNARIETSDGGETWEYVVYHGRYYGSRSVRYVTHNRGKTWE